MIYEILDADGNVINTIQADLAFMQAAYPEGNYREVAEPTPPPDPVIRTLPAGAFRLRFTFTERAGVELASNIDPAASAETQKTQATVKTFYADMCSQRAIDLDSPGVMRGCALLDGLGILENGWKARIIDADPTPDELHFGS
jgi:hypothetical protein